MPETNPEHLPLPPHVPQGQNLPFRTALTIY
uniref:Uncharacterized protein n=1 Tax=Arundo donax TaxID=35708 RepID=A0A0A9B6E9_ARUDO